MCHDVSNYNSIKTQKYNYIKSSLIESLQNIFSTFYINGCRHLDTIRLLTDALDQIQLRPVCERVQD